MPVLIVNGEKDSGVPSKYAIKASKVIKNCQLHIMKGCNIGPKKKDLKSLLIY
ncbi:alpha/beta fold hydrolase [Vallitalea maricola]|uniref:alpha/beta fold hydrolase n=1 Tax=Vallitalea maricola TaxID=3074433 RepID=UPI0030DCC31E